MNYQLSYPSRLRITPKDRSAIERLLTLIKGVSSVGLQKGSSKYSFVRSPELKAANGGEVFTLTLQRGESQYDISVIAK